MFGLRYINTGIITGWEKNDQPIKTSPPKSLAGALVPTYQAT